MISFASFNQELLFEVSAIVSGGLLAFIFLRDFFKRKRNKNQFSVMSGSAEDILVVELEKIHALWREQAKIEVYLENLAKLWRTYDEEADSKSLDEKIDFKHDLILEFYVNYLRNRTWFKGKIKEVILEILKLLDREGDVPSVVKTKNESFVLEQNTYTMLSKVSLLKHSINVAVEGMNLGVSGVLEPQLVIACLSHDLGKIPKYLSKLYTLGDHPLISVIILEKEIKGFNELPFAEEVKQAVSLHHRTGKGKLAELLKKADAKARKKEISEIMEKQGEKAFKRIESEEKEKDKAETKVVEEKVTEKEKVEEVVKKEKEEVKEVSAGTFYQEAFEEKTDEKPVYEYDLSWLDVKEFLHELKKEINQVVGGKWIAFSMPDGVIYVHPKGMWNILKKIAVKRKIPELIMFEGDETLKRSILVSLVNLLWEENCIAEGYIKKGYFAAPFLIYREDEEQPTRVLYTPFKAEAFEVLPSELESKKDGILKKIRKVEPAYS